MAKRKQNPLPITGDVVRNAGLFIIVFLALFFIVQGVSGYLTHAPFFTVKDIEVGDNIKPIDIPELARLKGQNIFRVDLDRVEAKIRAKYPQFSDLQVLRRPPDAISVTAQRREAFALAAFAGRNIQIDRNACIIGFPAKDAEPLPIIKGLQSQKTFPGDKVLDEHVVTGIDIVGFIRADAVLSKAGFKSVDVTDPAHVVLMFGLEKISYEVIMDKEKSVERLKPLAHMLGRNDLDLLEVKYIDLRFDEPVIGRKKMGKKP
ncbi:MAG: hypothetical protein HQL19_02440 [Candidatus Omnitrophica bacterium]|nr:hypothetical protein [Candidatus Omnitrophota bacterium]